MPDRVPADPPPRTATMLVAAAVIGCATVYATVFFSGSTGSLLVIAGGIVWLLAYVALRRLVQEAADLPDDRLDEREVALRDRSYLQAYRILGAAVAVSLALAIVDDAVGDVVRSWNGAWASLLLLSVILPSAVLAHRQQNEVSAA